NAITITIELKDAKKDTERVEYSVRAGQAGAKPKHDQLPTPEEAMTQLDDLLADLQAEYERDHNGKPLPPPEVRIACRKELPPERVYEIRRELEKLKQRGAINAISATVIEAPKKQ